jgi:DNA repair protein RecO (recombination protein O)
MIESTTGLILRTCLLTETSLIVHWLTPDLGRVATVAKGARRPKSPFQGKLDLFYAADFSFTRSRRSDLHALREVRLLETHGTIREELGRLRQAGYAVAFIEQVTETDTPLAGIYALFREFLACLCEVKPVPQIIFTFELKLLRELGQSPDTGGSNLAAGTKKIAAAMTQNDWAASRRLKLTEAQILELRQFLHGFLIFHLERLPRGRAAALAG